MTAVLRAEALSRVYGRPGSPGAVTAVENVTLDFNQGLLHAIVGPSGSGKSTLLHLLSTLDRPTSGRVLLGGRDTSVMKARALSRLREDTGFIFQRFNLVPSLTAAQNITLPLDLAGRRTRDTWRNALTERLDLTALLDRHPHQLSGGQQQRVAIARALLGRPTVVFGDEPTGSLDQDSAHAVTLLLAELAREGATTFVVVTHDDGFAAAADRVIRFVDGHVEDDQGSRAAPAREPAVAVLAAPEHNGSEQTYQPGQPGTFPGQSPAPHHASSTPT